MTIDLGSLGVLDWKLFGFMLRLRWEWIACTNVESCWAKLPSKKEKVIEAMAWVSMNINMGDGSCAWFWIDNWSLVGPLCRFAPNLFAVVSRMDRRRTLKDVVHQNRWVNDIVRALTT